MKHFIPFILVLVVGHMIATPILLTFYIIGYLSFILYTVTKQYKLTGDLKEFIPFLVTIILTQFLDIPLVILTVTLGNAWVLGYIFYICFKNYTASITKSNTP